MCRSAARALVRQKVITTAYLVESILDTHNVKKYADNAVAKQNLVSKACLRLVLWDRQKSHRSKTVTCTSISVGGIFSSCTQGTLNCEVTVTNCSKLAPSDCLSTTIGSGERRNSAK